MIEEISHIALSNNFDHAREISNLARDALSTAIKSITSINRKTLHKSACSIHVEAKKEKWDSNLTVQRKFSDACSLEKESRVWNRILAASVLVTIPASRDWNEVGLLPT